MCKTTHRYFVFILPLYVCIVTSFKIYFDPEHFGLNCCAWGSAVHFWLENLIELECSSMNWKGIRVEVAGHYPLQLIQTWYCRACHRPSQTAIRSHHVCMYELTCISLCSDEGPPCTCPLCASDWSSCVPHSEGLQLSRDLGATYLELPSLNHVFVGRYFGSVVSDDTDRII